MPKRLLGINNSKLEMTSFACASRPVQELPAVLNRAFTTPSLSMMFWYTIDCKQKKT